MTELPAKRRLALESVVEKIQELPTLPTIIGEMNKLMLDPKTTAKHMGNLISSDPSITSKILRVVNSPFYGFPSRIATITHAIVILGFNTVKSIVLSVSFFGVDSSGKKSLFDMTAFWEHSVSVGACTKVMAKRAGHSDIEELFIAGLLHDIGKLIFSQYFSDELDQAIQKSRDREIPLRKAEEEVFGITHAELGGYLLQNWKLSKGLVDAVSYHHSPSEAGESLKIASLVHMGDILARALSLGNGGDLYVPEIEEAAWSGLELDESQFPLILQECWEESAKARVFLEFM